MKYRLCNFNFFLNNCVNLPEYLFLTVFGEFQDGIFRNRLQLYKGEKLTGQKCTVYTVFLFQNFSFHLFMMAQQMKKIC